MQHANLRWDFLRWESLWFPRPAPWRWMLNRLVWNELLSWRRRLVLRILWVCRGRHHWSSALGDRRGATVVCCCLVKFLDLLQTNYQESICQGCAHWSRTKVRRLTSLSWFSGWWCRAVLSCCSDLSVNSVTDRDFSLLSSVKCGSSWISSQRDCVCFTQRSLRQHMTWHKTTHTTHDTWRTPQHNSTHLHYITSHFLDYFCHNSPFWENM